MPSAVRRESVGSLTLHRFLDVGLNALAIALAYAAKEALAARGIREPTQPISPALVLHMFIAVTLIWFAVTSILETYRYKRRLFAELVNLAAAQVLTIAFLMTYVYFTRLFDVPRSGVIFYGVLSFGMIAASRGIKLASQRVLHRHGYFIRRTAIIGNGPVGQRLADAMRSNPSLGQYFVGFVRDEPGPDTVGSLSQLESLIDEQRIEELIITLPGAEHAATLDIVARCQPFPLRVRIVPDVLEAVLLRATVSEIDDIPLIGLRDPAINGTQSIVKRLFDLSVAAFLLVLSAPIMAVIAVLIRLDGRGRVLFVQARAGENGRPFRMYKFRTMVEDAEERLAELIDLKTLPEPTYKLRNDPRVTRTGRWLRRTSLDELPQLFNVIKGDMSLVGPRPEMIDVVSRYSPWHRKRLSVKPGITGPMQVSGRADLPLDERIRLELTYISRYSLLEDVKYLLRTIPAVCRGRGAY